MSTKRRWGYSRAIVSNREENLRSAREMIDSHLNKNDDYQQQPHNNFGDPQALLAHRREIHLEPDRADGNFIPCRQIERRGRSGIHQEKTVAFGAQEEPAIPGKRNGGVLFPNPRSFNPQIDRRGAADRIGKLPGEMLSDGSRRIRHSQ
jgi:hypothetical protein